MITATQQPKPDLPAWDSSRPISAQSSKLAQGNQSCVVSHEGLSASGSGFACNTCSNNHKRTQEPPSWTQSEDLRLHSLSAECRDCNWVGVSEHFPGRCPEACRLRWQFLTTRSRKVGTWNAREQTTLFKLYVTLGQDWQRIGRRLPLRSPNSIKSFVHASLRKIRKAARLFWSLKKLACWPVFINNSTFIDRANPKCSVTSTAKTRSTFVPEPGRSSKRGFRRSSRASGSSTASASESCGTFYRWTRPSVGPMCYW